MKYGIEKIVYLMTTTEGHVFRISKTDGANLHSKKKKKEKIRGAEVFVYC